MLNHLRTTAIKTDNHVGFDNLNKRRLSEADIILLIKELNNKDIEAGNALLLSAIKKGTLLRFLKEKCHHGSWGFHLKTVNINQRKAQRLMSLVSWESQLLSENEKSIKKSQIPLSVNQALALVAAWSKLDITTDENVESPGHYDTNDKIFFEPTPKQKKDTLTITWTVKLADISRTMEMLDIESSQVIETFKTILRQHQQQ